MPNAWRIKPSLGNVLVQPLQEEEVTESGIILVTQIEKETHIAEVVETCEPYEAVAADRTLAKAGPIYAKGQLVVIGKYNGRDIKIKEESTKPHVRYIIIRETDILGTLELREEKDGDADSSSTASA